MLNKLNEHYFCNQMLFSLFGEIGLVVIGLLYVCNCWFDSFIEVMAQIKNNDDETKLPESVKHIYS